MKNYRVSCVLSNFETDFQELDFGDFKIISIKHGPEAAEWRKKIGCKSIPEYILIKDFNNYIMEIGDISGFGGIHKSLRENLIIFRLFQIGDIIIGDYVIEDKTDQQNFINLISTDRPSVLKYKFDKIKINKFLEFKNTIKTKKGWGNKYLQFALDHFMQGIDKGIFYQIGCVGKIIDYTVALESLFLIDNQMFFLRKTLSERIGKFLEDDSIKLVVKNMYDERSNIVHGNYIEEPAKLRKKLEPQMENFEQLMRRILVKLFRYNFSSKAEIIEFMENLYKLPSSVLDKMNTAKLDAENFL